MKVKELCERLDWELCCGEGEAEITGGVYCGDLLSIVMSHAPAGCLWATIMANANAMAVSSLNDCACVVLCEGMRADDATREGAAKGGVTVLRTEKPIFEAALQAAKLLGIA